MDITLESLGYKPYFGDFIPEIMKAEYANDFKYITIWKDGEISSYTRKNEEHASLSFQEVIACANLIKEKGWCNIE